MPDFGYGRAMPQLPGYYQRWAHPSRLGMDQRRQKMAERFEETRKAAEARRQEAVDAMAQRRSGYWAPRPYTGPAMTGFPRPSVDAYPAALQPAAVPAAPVAAAPKVEPEPMAQAAPVVPTAPAPTPEAAPAPAPAAAVAAPEGAPVQN
jgi:hypothetical protein